MNRPAFIASGIAAALMPAAARSGGDALQQRIESAARLVDGTLGVYCRMAGANDMPLAAYNAEETFPTASTIKVLILATAFHAEEEHPGTLDQTIVWRRRNLIGGSDFMQGARDGERFRVRALLKPMIQVSDNSASNVLIGFFGIPAINRIGEAAGLSRTRLARRFLDYAAIVRHNENVTTPADMAALLTLIADGARAGGAQPQDETASWTPPLLRREHCRAMIDIMLGQTDRDGIPAGLPPHVQVANKTGAVDGTRNDVAIVSPYGDQPFVLAIFSKNLRSYANVYSAMRRIAGASARAAQET